MRLRFNTNQLDDGRVELHPSQLDVQRIFDLNLDRLELLSESGDVYLADVLDVDPEPAWGGAFVWVELA